MPLTSLAENRFVFQAGHGSTETFALLSAEGGLRYQPAAVADINAQRYFKVVPTGQEPVDVFAVAFTPTGKSLEPFRVANFAGELNGADWELSWNRRARHPFRELSMVSPPILESSERYQIDIMDGGNVARTIAVEDATSATYTEAQQITDFGSAQASITARVYQISDVLGRGNVREETLP